MPTFWLDKPGEYHRLNTTDNDPLPGSPLDVLVGRSYPYATTNAAEIGALRENFGSYVSERAGVERTRNLISNPSFEVNLATWFTGAFAGATYTFDLSSSNFTVGSKSAKLTASWDAQDVQHLVYIISQQNPVTPGKTYYVKHSVNVTQVPVGSYVQTFIRWLKADNSQLADAFVQGSFGTGTQTFAGSAIAPANAASAQVYTWIARNSNPAKTTSTAEFYADAYIMSDADVNYFDGAGYISPWGWTTLSTAWSGTPHASPAILYA